MAISPNQEEALAAEIRRIYEDAEIQLLKMMARRLAKDGSAADWQQRKLAELSPLLKEAREITGDLNKKIPKEILKIIELAYLAGDESAMADLKAALEAIQESGQSVAEYPEIQMALFPASPLVEIDVEAALATMSGVNTEAIAALAGATTQTLLSNHVPIVRATEDIYRAVITSVAGSVFTGVETRLEATQRALNQFTKNGIMTFRDKSGRNWNIGSYSEMATRSAIGQASLAGHVNKMNRMGFDLVQVSDHTEECELCRPWEGKVLSTTGETPGYRTLAEATAAGLHHPNCGHRVHTYIEGLTRPLTNTEDPDGYEKRKQQRYLERGIRDWKRRQATAITPREKALTDDKVGEWNDRMKEFIDDTGRRRKRERESLKNYPSQGAPKKDPPKQASPKKATPKKAEPKPPKKDKPLEDMTMGQLKAEARRLAEMYYPVSGINYPDVNRAIDQLMAQNRSKTSLIKDIRSMRRKLKEKGML